MGDTFTTKTTCKVLEPTQRLRWWADSRYKEPRLEQWHVNHCEPFDGEWVAVPVVIEEPPFYA